MSTASSEVRLAALVAISDPLSSERREQVDKLESVLANFNLECIKSEWLFEETTPQHKAAELNGFFGLSDVDYIFDLSGGNLANTVLEYLDYDLIGKSKAVFFGYSDLSAVINAIYTLSDKKSVLYHLGNLIGSDSQWQQIKFADFLLSNGSSLFEFPYEFLRGNTMEGRLVGGNLRCTLKLAGTRFFPVLKNNILLIESLGGNLYQTISQIAQLRSQNGFEEVSGVLLGTFCRIESEGELDKLTEYVLEAIPDETAVARTSMIGHGDDSAAAYVGRRIRLEA